MDEFENGLEAASTSVRAIDHVNLSQPWQTFDDAVLFLTSVFGLSADTPTEVPGPSGLVRSQSMRTADGGVRLLLNVAPHVLGEAGMPQHVAFVCSDVVGLARAARALGGGVAVGAGQLLRLPGRAVRPRAGTVAELRELDLLYDRDSGGEFVHFYTRTVGTVFFEFVQRRGRYDGYGADNAPVRLAAQRRARVGTVRT